MANGHGGQRTPRNPAPVSGPGALSRRTDGRQPARWIPADQYGDGAEMMNIQTSAPMSEVRQPSPAATSVGGGSSIQDLTPLFAPTQRPNEPAYTLPDSMNFAQKPSLAEKLYKAMGDDISGEFDEIASIAMRFGL